MPKKKQPEPTDEQSKRFVEDAQRMIDAGELNPIEAEAAIDKMATFAPLAKSRKH